MRDLCFVVDRFSVLLKDGWERSEKFNSNGRVVKVDGKEFKIIDKAEKQVDGNRLVKHFAVPAHDSFFKNMVDSVDLPDCIKKQGRVILANNFKAKVTDGEGNHVNVFMIQDFGSSQKDLIDSNGKHLGFVILASNTSASEIKVDRFYRANSSVNDYQGIGSAMMEFVVKLLLKSDSPLSPKALLLDSTPDSPAFYCKMGFRYVESDDSLFPYTKRNVLSFAPRELCRSAREYLKQEVSEVAQKIEELLKKHLDADEEMEKYATEELGRSPKSLKEKLKHGMFSDLNRWTARRIKENEEKRKNNPEEPRVEFYLPGPMELSPEGKDFWYKRLAE